MADSMSALQTTLPLDVSIGDAVTIGEVREFSLVQIAAWPDTLAAVAQFGSNLAKVSQAPGPGFAANGDHGHFLRVEPLKWWVIAQGSGQPLPDLTSDMGSVLDLSHSRVWIKITGDKAEELLNKFLPLDLRVGQFPVGSVASTAFHHVGVTLWRDEQGYSILVPRSFAASLCELLVESASQFSHAAT